MHMEEKDGLLLMFQIDHLSGEEVQWVLETEDIPGLKNRQLIPTLTKKGRPGYLLLLDLDPGTEAETIQSISEYLPVFGYHRFNTKHIFIKGESRVIKVVVNKNGKKIWTQMRIRLFSFAGGIRRHFLESNDLLILHRRIKKVLKVDIAPLALKYQIDSLLKWPPRGRLEIKL